MPNSTKNLIYIIIVVLIVAVAGGVFYYGLYYKKTVDEGSTPITTIEPVDPETQVDIQVQQAGRKYTDSEIVDNKIKRTFYTGNVEYLADDGSYQLIDTNLVESANENYVFENTSNMFKTYFRDDTSTDDLITLNVGEKSVAFSFVEPNESTPTIKSNTLTYTEILDGLDAKYTITGSQFLEELVAEEAIEIDKISQKIKVEDVYYKERDDGSIAFHNSETKNLLWMLPTPVMYEQDDMTQRNYGLHYEITEVDGYILISKVIDDGGKEWMISATYPIVIDYSLTFYNPNTSWDLEGYIRRRGYPPVSDSYDAYPGTNYDLGRTGGYSSGFYSYNFRTFFNFDVTSLYGSIESAYLEHYSTKNGTPNFDINVYAGADAWSGIVPTRAVYESDLVMGDSDSGTDDPMVIFSTGTLPYGCAAPADCRQQTNIPQALLDTVFNSGDNAQFLFVCTGSCEGFSSLRGMSTYMSLYEENREPRLVVEFVVDPPVLSIIPVIPQGQNIMDLQLEDKSNNETYWRIERSTNGLNYFTVCTQMITGWGPNQSCTGGNITYDCTETNRITQNGEYCYFRDSNLTPGTQYYYRAITVDQSTNPNSYSPYSNVVSQYSLTDSVDTAPSLESRNWGDLHVTNLPTTSSPQNNGPDIEYCIEAYDFDDACSATNPFTPPVYAEQLIYYYLNDNVSNRECRTASEWDNWYSCSNAPLNNCSTDNDCDLRPCNIIAGLCSDTFTSCSTDIDCVGGAGSCAGPGINDAAALHLFGWVAATPFCPNSKFTFGISTQGGSSGYESPVELSEVYTRAWAPRSPSISAITTISANVELYMYTYGNTVTYPNQPDTLAALRATSGSNTYYVNPSNGQLQGTESWGVYESNFGYCDVYPSYGCYDAGDCPGANSCMLQTFGYCSDDLDQGCNISADCGAGTCETDDWGGSSGISVSLTPSSCYTFSARTRNHDGIMGEDVNDPAQGWVSAAQTCTLAATPGRPTVVCSYDHQGTWDDEQAGIGYNCRVTVNPGLNPTGPNGAEFKIYSSICDYNGLNCYASDVRDWSTDLIWPDESLSCDRDNFVYEYYVTARNPDVPGDESAPSAVGSDTLPPCPVTIDNIPGTAVEHYENPICRGKSYKDDGSRTGQENTWCTQAKPDDAGAEYPIYWRWSQATTFQDQFLNFYQVYQVVPGGVGAEMGYLPENESSVFDIKEAFAAAPSSESYYCMAGVPESMYYCGDAERSRLWTDAAPYVQTWYDFTGSNFGINPAPINIPQVANIEQYIYYKQFFRSGDDSNEPWMPDYTLPNTEYQISVRGIDDRLRMGALSNPNLSTSAAYTSIERPQYLIIENNNISDDSIGIQTWNKFFHCPVGGGGPTEPFCNLEDESFVNTGLQNRETTFHLGGGNDGGADGFYLGKTKSINISDRNLSVNRRYCYDARAVNEDYVDADNNGESDDEDLCNPLFGLSSCGDSTEYNYNLTEKCKYTLASEPNSPILTRQPGDTTMNVAIRTNDKNPHRESEQGAGDAPDTQYALCLTRYDEYGGVEFANYIDPFDGEIVSGCTNTDPACDAYDVCVGTDTGAGECSSTWTSTCDTDGHEPDSGIWAPYDNISGVTNWGGASGVLVNLVTAGKYDFMLKARNGNAIDNNVSACSNGVSDGGDENECQETVFGRPATLFLVKNNVVGWAWSSNIGWLSLNCLNFYNTFGHGYSCNSANDWGLNTFFEPSREVNPLEGYAWSASGQALEDIIGVSNSNLNFTKAKGIVYDNVTANGPYIWVTRSEDTLNQLVQIKAGPMTVANTYNLNDAGKEGNDVRGIVFDGEFLWIASRGNSRILKFDPNTNGGEVVDIEALGSIQLSDCGGLGNDCYPFGIAYDGTDLWVANDDASNGRVFRIGASDSVEKSCDGFGFAGDVNRCQVGGNPTWPYVNGDYVWVANYSSSNISKIDRVGALGVVGTYAVGGLPYEFAFDSGTNDLWLTHNSAGGNISLINPDGTVGGTISGIGDELLGITYHEVEGEPYMWAVSYTDDKVYQIKVSDQSIKNTYDVGDGPWQIILDAQDDLWVTNHDGTDNAVSKIHPTTIPTTAGLGWVSLFKNVCENDMQTGCSFAEAVSSECGNTPCIASAGDPPDNVTYGYCYNVSSQRYGSCTDGLSTCGEFVLDNCWGKCSNDINIDCKLPTDCGGNTCVKDPCILETCKIGDTCPDDVDVVGDEVCKTTATANFNGVTQEIEGWSRILSMKDEGLIQSPTIFDDWGWMHFQGQYNDGQGNSGNYGLSGTEVDSQVFLGDPDVNPLDIQLYSLFGWAWNSQVSDYKESSSWLPPVNVSQIGVLPKTATGLNYSRSTLVLDSIGDPHISWSNLEDDGTYNIYYLKLKEGRWVTVTGDYYQPGVFTSSVNVTNVSDIIRPSTNTSHSPILALDSSDNPHIAWVETIGVVPVNNIYYLNWNPANNRWESALGIDRASAFADPSGSELIVETGDQLSMVLDRSNRPHIAYVDRDFGVISYRWWNDTSWVSASGDLNNLNVSYNNPSRTPSLALSNDSTQLPHIVWIDGYAEGELYYRHWDDVGQEWETASGDAAQNSSANDLHVNWDVGNDEVWELGLADNNWHGANPDIALYSDNQPGIVWRDPEKVLYRKWDGAWVSAMGFPDNSAGNTWLNPAADINYNAHNGIQTSVVIKDDRPYVAFSDGDVHLRYWDDVNLIWVSADGTEQDAHNDEPFNVTKKSLGRSVGTTLVLDKLGNMHLAWSEQTRSDTDCTINGDDDCTDPNYPHCMNWYPDPDYCATSDVNYTKWIPGIVQSGLGWFEFFPAGSLLGIPWLQTSYSNIFSESDISLSPPPRGSGSFTSTYLILSNGSIQGIPSYYSGSTSGQPTSQYYLAGLDSLIEGASLPFGENALSKIDVDALITETGGKNRYGHDVEILSGGELNTSLVTNVLDNSIYYYNGDAEINSDITIEKGDSTLPTPTAGNGLIVVDGDLEINANVYYQKSCSITTATSCRVDSDCTTGGEVCQNVKLDDISEMPSLAFIVRGNIYINPFVDEVSGAIIALDNPNTTEAEGNVSTNQNTPIVSMIDYSENDTYVNKDGSDYVNDVTTDELIIGDEPSNRTFLRWEFGQGKQFDIPPGSEIISAYIKLHGNTTPAVGDFTSRIYLIGDPYKNMFRFNDASFIIPNAGNLYNIKVNNSRTYEMIAADWHDGDGDDGINYSPDIKSLVRKYINNDEYTTRYNNDEALFMGIEITNGDATAGQSRKFYSEDHATGTPPELVIEYSQRRVSYGIDSQDNSAFADDNSGTGHSICGQYCPFGWSDDPTKESMRTYLRFVDIDIPKEAEIQEAYIRTELSRDGTVDVDYGDNAYQMRTGLIAGDPGHYNTATGGHNPFDDALDTNVSEIAQDITDEQWVTSDGECKGDVATNGDSCTVSSGCGAGWCKLDSLIFNDITPIVESYISRIDYNPGIPGDSEMSLRLRRGSNLVEDTEGIGEIRSIRSYDYTNSVPLTSLDIDYLVPLKINGLLIAEGFNFDRKYSQDLAPAERIVYDGRVVANTPPGLSDFTKTLPIYQRVAP